MGQVAPFGAYQSITTIAELRAALVWARHVFVYVAPLDDYVQVSKESVRRSIKGCDGSTPHAAYVPGMNHQENIGRSDTRDLYIG